MKIFGVDLKSGSSVTIDGKTFTGRSITITGDQVIVDGVTQGGTLAGPVTVTVNGDADSVQTTSGDVVVKGSSGRVNSTSGDIECGNVSGDVQTVSGDVRCRSVSGSVRSVSGDINH